MTDRRPRIVVLGGASLDVVLTLPALPTPHRPQDATSHVLTPGGKGFNQAVAAARLEASVALVAAVGDDDAGRRVLAGLAADGVDTSHVRVDGSTGTGVAVVLVPPGGEAATAAAAGANARVTPSHVTAAADAIAAADWLLVQLEVPLPAVAAAVELAAAHGVRVLIDPAPAQSAGALPAELLAAADVVTPNAAEAEVLTGVAPTDVAAAREVAGRLRGQGARAAVVPGGDSGQLLVWAGGERWLPHLPVAVVDTTGAGDAFAAALAVAAAGGAGYAEAARFATAAAALTTTRLGASPALPRRAEVDRMLAANTGAAAAG